MVENILTKIKQDYQQKAEEKKSIFKKIRKDFFSIPISIRMVSLSMFLFILGRGLGGDTFFSIYIKSIVDNVFWISVIGSILPLIKMFFSISVGQLDDHSDVRSVIFVGKMFFVLTSICFFFAGIQHLWLLMIGVLLNAIGSASLLTSYHTWIRKYSKIENRSAVFGLFFSSINLAYVVGALLAALLIKYMPLPYVYLFICIFSLISLLTDKKLPHLAKEKIQEFLGKESFLHQFFREAFSLRVFRKTMLSIKDVNKKLFSVWGYEFLYGALNYIGFLFIPIISVKNDLSLSQIAIIFAIMRLPYVFNFFTGEFADKYNKKKFILMVLFFISFLFALLGFREGFGEIVIISLGISFGLSLIRPVIEGLISDYTDSDHGGRITGITEFVARFGEFFGALSFGLVSLIMGMSLSFILIGIFLFFFSLYGIIRKFRIIKK